MQERFEDVIRTVLFWWCQRSYGFLIVKPTRCTNFSNLFLEWNSTCFGQFLCPTSGIFSLYTQQWYMSYRFADSLQAGSGCSFRMEHPDTARKLSANLYDIYTYHCCVYSEKIPDVGQRNCPKHIELHSKNKFEKLVHLVGFIIRNLSRCAATWTSKLWITETNEY